MTTSRFHFQENTEDIEQILSKLDGDSILNTPGIRSLLIFEIELVHQANLGKCNNQVTFLSLFCEFVKIFHRFPLFQFLSFNLLPALLSGRSKLGTKVLDPKLNRPHLP